MVRAIRQVEQAMGSPRKRVVHSEAKNQTIARKSLVALHAIAQGERFTTENLGVKRPGTGISPMRYWEFLGKLAQRDFSVDEIIVS